MGKQYTEKLTRRQLILKDKIEEFSKTIIAVDLEIDIEKHYLDALKTDKELRDLAGEIPFADYSNAHLLKEDRVSELIKRAEYNVADLEFRKKEYIIKLEKLKEIREQMRLKEETRAYKNAPEVV